VASGLRQYFCPAEHPAMLGIYAAIAIMSNDILREPKVSTQWPRKVGFFLLFGCNGTSLTDTNRMWLIFRTAKARLLNVRLISMAMTGFFYTFKRPRTAPMMGMLKYDPIGTELCFSWSHLFE
jgi:large subunit ribosomal protein L33